MYDLVMTQAETSPGISVRALNHALALRGMTPADLARETGVSKATLSLLLSERRANPTAANVAAMARALDVSTDYLMGLSDEPEPRELQLGQTMMELIKAARQLPRRRLRDLMAMARTFLATNEQDELDLAHDLLDLVRKDSGVSSHRQLLDILALADESGDVDRILGEDDTEIPGEDES